MLKKAKLYSLLALIVASTVVGLFGFSQPVKAQSSGEVDATLTAQAENTIYKKLLYQCVDRFGVYTPSVEDIREGDIIRSATNTSGTDSDDSGWLAGYLVDPVPGDGKLSCYGSDGDKIISKYKSATNYSTPSKYQSNSTLSDIHFLCTIGFRPIDEETGTATDMSIDQCVEKARENGDDQRYGIFRNDVENPVFGPAQQYVAYRFTLFNACSPELATDETQTTNRYSVPMIQMDGSPSIVDYILPNNKDVSVYQGKKVNCRDIPGEMENTAAAYVSYRQDPNNKDNDGITDGNETATPGGNTEDHSTCRVDGIGWIVCPVVNLMAEMVDSSYYLLDNSLLRTPAISLDTDAPLYKAWKLMRDFANVAFVLIFMFIIFSQITSFGISNYGIKQLLPKLIIAAILVNLSYMICALAVDASNIFGSELKGFFDSLADDIDTGNSSGKFEWASDGKGKAGVIGWGAIAGSILIAASIGGGVLAILALLVPFLFAALGAVIATVITLIIRQALIIILIFVAPLAFVALLLPNTEGYFKSWRKLFQSLLLLYPVIAIVFGGSALASRIIMSAAEASTGDTALGEGLGGMTQTLLQLSGAAVSVIPLFLVPAVIKAVGGALNRFAGIVNNPNKGPIDWARNRSMKGIERKQKNLATKAFDTGRRTGVRGRAKDFVTGRSKYHRDADMKREDADRDREMALQEANYGASQVKKNIDPSTANDRQMRELAGAISTQEELKTRELKAATLIIEDENFSGEDRQQLALQGYIQKPQLDADGNVKRNEKGEVVMGPKQFQSETMQKAAAIMQFTTGSAAEKMAIAEATAISEKGEGSLAKFSAEIAQAAAKTGFPGAAPQAAGKGIDDIAQNNFNFKQRTMEGLAEGRFTSESVAGMNDKIFKRTVETVDAEIAEIAKAKTKGVSTQEERNALEAREAAALKAVNVLQQAAAGIKGKDTLQGKIEGNELMEGLVNDLVNRSIPTHIGPANIPVTSPSTPSGSAQPTPSAPTAPQQPNSAPSPTTINGGRQRDWSGYGQSAPADTGMPTQTESPTFTPGQSSTPTPSTTSGGRQRDWSGYDQPSNATADAMEKVAKELKNTASQMDENNSYGTVERLKEAVSSTTAQTMQQFYDNQPTSTPASPTPPSTPPTINGGRQRDWSGYNMPVDNTPTQTESPTYRPGSNNPK